MKNLFIVVLSVMAFCLFETSLAFSQSTLISFGALTNYSTSIAPAVPKDLTAEEIVAKHLDSIGTKERRAEIKNMMLIGNASFRVIRSPDFNRVSVTAGRMVLISEPNKLYFGTKYPSNQAPGEEIIYDAKDVGVSFITPGVRSVFGEFVNSHRVIVSQGIFGGTLSNAWGLFDLDSKKAKVKAAGKKKIDNRPVYVLEYRPDGGSAATIRLFFDAETFQHVRTEYQHISPAPMVRNQVESAGQVQRVQTLTEEFSNFKAINGITLPYSYRVDYLIDGRATSEWEWKFELGEVLFNEKLDSKTFDLQ